MVVAIVIGTRVWRPSRPLAWYLIAFGQLLFTAGDAYSSFHEWVLGLEVPFPSIADVFYLAFYPVLAAALLLLVRGRAPGRDAASLIDATIITTGIGMLSWVFLIRPYVRLPDLSLTERLVSIAYPLGDVLLLAVAVRLWRTGRHSAVASRLLAFGLFALMAADTVYGLSLLNGDWQAGGPVDAVWMVYFAAFGLASLHPSMVSLSEPTPSSTRLTRTRLALLAGASLMAPAVLVIQTLRDEPIDVGVIAGGSVVLFLLALARIGGLASEVAMQTERKRAMQTVLRATEHERVRLAADLHDGPVQELTALRYGLTRARNRVRRGQAEEAEGLLAELEDELASGITGLRRPMTELRPAVLDEQGLEVALHNQVSGLRGDQRRRLRHLDRPAGPARPRPGDGPVPGRPGDAQQRGQARRCLQGHRLAGVRERLGAPTDQRPRNRLRPGRGQPPPQRGPLWPGRHALASRDGRRPAQDRLRPRPGHHHRGRDGQPSGRAAQHLIRAPFSDPAPAGAPPGGGA
ncbi:MAG TPA: histidine kinase [Actinomycetes bacterium]|nr:histidine kinase [Actinomycetes bacterium]